MAERWILRKGSPKSGFRYVDADGAAMRGARVLQRIAKLRRGARVAVRHVRDVVPIVPQLLLGGDAAVAGGQRVADVRALEHPIRDSDAIDYATFHAVHCLRIRLQASRHTTTQSCCRVSQRSES